MKNDHCRNRHRTEAFTLIELLVVISIMSLLISLLLPALGSARTAAQQTASLSNVRQILIALNAYAVDNGGSMPVSFWNVKEEGPNTHPLSSQGLRWTSQLVRDGYLADRRALWSPAKDIGMIDSLNTTNWKHFDPWRHPGYAANSYMMPAQSDLDSRKVANLDKVNPFQADEALALLDAYDLSQGIHADNAQGALTVVPKEGNGLDGVGAFTYNGAPVRGYFDGHAVAGDALEISWVNFGGPRAGDWLYGVTSSAYERAPWFRNWWDQ